MNRISLKIRLRVILFIMLLFVTTTNAQDNITNHLVSDIEVSIGKSAKEQLLEIYGGESKLAFSEYLLITEIFNRLTAVANPDINYSLTVLNSSQLNAFALPGGYVFITRGLQNLFANDIHRLAAVLAHEIAHVELKHGINSMLRQVGFTILLELGVYYLDIPPSKAMRVATISLVEAVQSGYSRDAEFAADNLGQEYLAKAGFDPAGGIRMLADLRKLQKGKDSVHVFSTHPPILERINKLQNKLVSYWSVVSNPDYVLPESIGSGIDPLGRFILETRLNEAGIWQLTGFDIQGDREFVWLPNVEARSPCWSPQGGELAVVVKELEQWEIWFLNRVGSVTSKLEATIAGEPSNLYFSPDGSMIAYNCSMDNGSRQIFVNYIDGHVQLELIQDTNGLILGWGSQGILVQDYDTNDYYLIKPPLVKKFIADNPVPQVIERKTRVTPILEQDSDSKLILTRPSIFDL